MGGICNQERVPGHDVIQYTNSTYPWYIREELCIQHGVSRHLLFPISCVKMVESKPSPLPFSNDAGALHSIHFLVAIMVVGTVIFALFNISQFCFVKRPGWETRILYPLSYLYMLSSFVLGLCKSRAALGPVR